MTLQLDISPERHALLQRYAAARGLTLEQWLLELVEQISTSSSFAPLQRTDPQEWARQFHLWAESHDRTTPLLSDDAVSRETIYDDRV